MRYEMIKNVFDYLQHLRMKSIFTLTRVLSTSVLILLASLLVSAVYLVAEIFNVIYDSGKLLVEKTFVLSWIEDL